jgi:hypothetical protein
MTNTAIFDGYKVFCKNNYVVLPFGIVDDDEVCAYFYKITRDYIRNSKCKSISDETETILLGEKDIFWAYIFLKSAISLQNVKFSISDIGKSLLALFFIILFYGLFGLGLFVWTIEHSERFYQLVTWNRIPGEIVNRVETMRHSMGKRKHYRRYKVILADVAYWVNGDLQVKTVEYSGEQNNIIVYYDPSKIDEVRLAVDLKWSLIWLPILFLVDIAFIVSFFSLCKEFIINPKGFV